MYALLRTYMQDEVSAGKGRAEPANAAGEQCMHAAWQGCATAPGAQLTT